MKLSEHPLSFGGHELLLTNQRAIYWPREDVLILSDLHLGKAAHFRKHGIALPTTVSEQDLFRLQQLLVHYHPGQVIIVGDLIHAGANKEVESFRNLALQFPETCFSLIKGNHDKYAASKLNELGISHYYDTLQLQNIHFSHYPVQHEIPTISGHIHPGVSVRMPHGKYLRFPCFALTGNLLILPAFSLFTGLDTRSLSEKTAYYAIHEEGIFTV
ncbi:ligase-associated DNA damage response endonuclease PdeM [Proteiniphilum sp. X52]|uniref:ligase-associated DNA damage response endonuclease PdeM n=1 Tax=Proteiniphilum sp. X52 TaxID=2382159 RepID=UPI000F09C4BB|nr:ligase-associated DNA damage response endonuclease PdeM [Proteiniphilum sp. X52]RNC64915.1 ligase-associated DNA damage response endonuclease PdeM [Proteiniphilum sp. X52]